MNKKFKSALLAISLFVTFESSIFSGLVFSKLGSNGFYGYEKEPSELIDAEASQPLSFRDELIAIYADYKLEIEASEYLQGKNRLYSGCYTTNEIALAKPSPLYLAEVRRLKMKLEADVEKVKNDFFRKYGLSALKEEELKIDIDSLPAVQQLFSKFSVDIHTISVEAREICNSDLTDQEKFQEIEKHIKKTPELREIREKMKREMDELPEVIRLREKFAADSSNK
jgi:hypothetical protein